MDTASRPRHVTRRTLRTVGDLVEAGLVPPDARASMERVAKHYAIAVPEHVAAQIDRRDASDPLARQYIPDERELVKALDEREDPIGDHRHSPVEGIVHRYRDRVLFKIVHTCPVYCRFCFRREMVGPGKEGNLTPIQIERARDYIRSHAEIREVIFTGGDPLILSPRRIRGLVAGIDDIAHVERMRWHTRVPVVEPHRIDAALVAALKPRRATPLLALHANHPREFTDEARQALQHLKRGGIELLSQSVLLKGINDDAGTLTSLMDAFRDNGVRPYYLHHPDLAPGTSHFRTSIRDGITLMQELRQQCPDTLPAYVLDLPGGYSKVNLESADAVETQPGQWRLRDDTGQWHDYHG